MLARATPIVVGAVVLAATPLLAGCKATAGLSEREVVVHFAVGTTLAEKGKVATACAVPHASPEPLPTSPDSPQARLNEVRFRVDTASQADIDALYRCLRTHPAALDVERVDP